MKHLGRVCMISATPEPEMNDAEYGPSASLTSSSEVSTLGKGTGKVIVPVELSLEQIGSWATQALSSPSIGSGAFTFPDPSPQNIFFSTPQVK